MLRNFVFTINNYSEDDEEKLQAYVPEKVSYLVYGREKGEKGTPHLQGYAELTKRTRFKALKKLFPTAHIESRRGSQTDAITYCKKDGNVVEIGAKHNQGRRTDVHDLHEDALAGVSMCDMFKSRPAMIKYHRGITAMKECLAREDKDFSSVDVVVHWGPPGSGKTRAAVEADPQAYFYGSYAQQVWFDGYEGEETVIFDDFEGEISYTFLLRLLDGYKFNVPTKGGHVWKRWKKVIITSNQHPSHWYNRVDISALNRRITEIREFK